MFNRKNEKRKMFLNSLEIKKDGIKKDGIKKKKRWKRKS